MTMASPDNEILPVDELPRRVRTAGEAAIASGALLPIPTRVHLLQDEGIPFAVRVNENVARKNRTAGDNRRAQHDPFAPPYEPELHVGAISRTHVLLLNKYNVLPDHLLLVTRANLPQTDLLDATDLEAALLALAAFDGLVFYNGGHEAGASQRHKHLQLVPLPLSPGPNPVPFTPLLEGLEFEQGIAHCRQLPFRHAVSRIPPEWWQAPHVHASSALAAWERLWRAIEYEITREQEQPVPYNLLMTREWMWLVPRSRGEYEGIGVNALGYAGALLVRDDAEHDRLMRVGPARLLTRTGISPA